MAERQRHAKGIMVLGVDGMDPRYTRYMVDQGKMPAMAEYIKRGACREDLVLLGGHPTITPPMWTTLATGCYANVHGITGFYRQHPEDLSAVTYALDSRDCKAESVWNCTAEAGKKTLVFHWPGSSWPPTSDSENLYVVDEDIKFTSNSVNELKKLFSFRIEVPDRRLEMEGVSPFYKEIFVQSFLWRDGILGLEQYRQEVERVLTELASPRIPYGEFETTLSAMISSGLLPAEYRTFANARREEAEQEAEMKKGKKRNK